MTATALVLFAAIVLGACLRAFSPRRRPVLGRRSRRTGAGTPLGGPLRTLDMVRGEPRGGPPIRLAGPGDAHGGHRRFGD